MTRQNESKKNDRGKNGDVIMPKNVCNFLKQYYLPTKFEKCSIATSKVRHEVKISPSMPEEPK